MEYVEDPDRREFSRPLELSIEIPRTGISQMQQDIGILQFFQGRPERADKIFGKIPDESDRIGNDDFTIMGKPQTGGWRYQVFRTGDLGGHMTIGQGVKRVDFPTLV